MSELKKPEFPKHKVQVSMGYTMNTGNFESLRMDVGIEVEGKVDESPEDTYARASKWVEDKLQAQVQQARADLEKG